MIAALVLMTGCTTGNLNRGTLIASSALIVCDGMQTWQGLARHDGARELNPIMGEHPSLGTIAAYFTTALALNALAWAVTPKRYRSAVSGSVAAIQAITVVGNAERPPERGPFSNNHAGWCGFR